MLSSYKLIICPLTSYHKLLKHYAIKATYGTQQTKSSPNERIRYIHVTAHILIIPGNKTVTLVFLVRNLVSKYHEVPQDVKRDTCCFYGIWRQPKTYVDRNAHLLISHRIYSTTNYFPTKSCIIAPNTHWTMQSWSVTFNRELGHDYKKTTKESHKFLTKQRDPEWAVSARAHVQVCLLYSLYCLHTV